MALLSRLSLVSSIFFSACGATSPELAHPPGIDVTAAARVVLPQGSPPASAWPPPKRLDPDVAPVRYDLSLTIDPSQPTFTGQARIEVTLARPQWVLYLHAEALEVTNVTLQTGDPGGLGGNRGNMVAQPVRPVTAELDGRGNLALRTDAGFSAGRQTLTLTYSAALGEAPVGLYRAQDAGRWYAFTQFEPLEARRAFPCFDEPGVKVPFGVEIAVPAPMVAVANMPLLGPDPAADASGWRHFRFQDTPPLPTYLIALAVGELDLVTHPPVSNAVPFRIIATHGKGQLAGFAARKTPLYLAALERWFGMPYPFAKLDQVAVPSFGSSGMENAAFITYREALLLMDGDHATADDRQWCEGVVAHELAHMWFGDLVTMAWWDDLWLNEAFATFMGRKVLSEVTPEFRSAESAVRSRFGVMGADARPGARAIRQPIAEAGDVYNAFDGITYSKGAAVLAMVESWLGRDVFRDGVRAYLRERAYASATTGDLLRHLAAASGGQPVDRVVASFADHAGVPSVDVRWSCPPQREGAATTKVAIRLRQTAYRGLGDTRPAGGPDVHLWSIPVCLAFGGDAPTDRRGHFCGVLEQAEETWTQELAQCPTWIYPNEDEAGYYRWTVAPRALPLAGSGMKPIDPRLVFGELDNLRAEVEADRLPVAVYLDRVMALAASPDVPDVLLSALTNGAGVVGRALPKGGEDPRYRRFVRKLLARQTARLDLGGPDATFDDLTRQPTIVRTLGATEDPKVLAEARRIAEGFLGDVEQDTHTTRMNLAAHYLPMHVRASGTKPAQAKARAALWQRLRAAFDKARDPTERDLIIESLAAFEDPIWTLKSYDLLLDGTLRAQDTRTLRGGTTGVPAILQALWTWLTTHFDQLVARLGPKSAPGLPGIASGFCSEVDAVKVEQFFESKKDVIPSGLEHNLRGTLEIIRQCTRYRALFEKPVSTWLAKH